MAATEHHLRMPTKHNSALKDPFMSDTRMYCANREWYDERDPELAYAHSYEDYRFVRYDFTSRKGKEKAGEEV